MQKQDKENTNKKSNGKNWTTQLFKIYKVVKPKNGNSEYYNVEDLNEHKYTNKLYNDDLQPVYFKTRKSDLTVVTGLWNINRPGRDFSQYLEQFEKMLADYVGTDYCLAFNSGTSAGHAALLALGIHSGDEIIVPSFSFIATVNWVMMVNAKPKFADIEEKTLGLDFE